MENKYNTLLSLLSLWKKGLQIIPWKLTINKHKPHEFILERYVRHAQQKKRNKKKKVFEKKNHSAFGQVKKQTHSEIYNCKDDK